MRIYYLVSSVNPWIPPFIDRVLMECRHEVVGVGRAAFAPRQSKLKWYRNQFSFWGVRGSCRYLLWVTRQKLWGMLLGASTSKSTDLVNVCRFHNVATEIVRDPNDAKFVDSIRARDVDVLISFQPWIFHAPLLAAPRKMCLNIHTGILPGYRGVRPVFRMMSDGLDELGITIHTMAEKIDTGRILQTAKWSNRPGSTLIENNRIAYQVAAKAVISLLDRLEHVSLETAEQIPPDSRYFGHPTRAEVKNARRGGLRLR
jgi:folate-dependent phosphoribosylglycinamide formyltransferase PurN